MGAYIPLLYSKVCADLTCNSVYDMRVDRLCPRCGFALGLPLSRYMNKPAQPSRPTRPDPRRERA